MSDVRIGICRTCRRSMTYGRHSLSGYLRHNARGQCGTCCQRDRRAGVEPEPRTARIGPCSVCGRSMIYARRARRGYLRHGGHNRCAGCHYRAWRGLPGPVLRPRKLKPLPTRDDLDWVVIDRLIRGIRVDANRWEVEAAILTMLARGVSQRSIPKRFGVPITERRVTRVVSRHRAQAQVGQDDAAALGAEEAA